jgi:hypothetical protein
MSRLKSFAIGQAERVEHNHQPKVLARVFDE